MPPGVTRSQPVLGVHPGPMDGSILTLQRDHISEDVWDGIGDVPLACRHHIVWPLQPQIRDIIAHAGFYGMSKIGHIPLDHALLTALVERWRSETHTFHFRVGEMTITLQDVAVILGLPIDGEPIIGNLTYDWQDLCYCLLGARPEEAIKGSGLRLSWLSRRFKGPIPDAATDVVIAQFARAYMLYVIGGVLFTDSSGDTVSLMFLPLLEELQHVGRYSWGSGTLSFLYRALCRASESGHTQLAGNGLLLQLWSWEHLHIGRPRRYTTQPEEANVIAEGVDLRAPLGARWAAPRSFRANPVNMLRYYRNELDTQRDGQVIWQPYTEELIQTLPTISLSGQRIWRSRTVLICFPYIEWHLPDRVMRQFGLLQHIPETFDTNYGKAELHSIDRRGRHTENWQNEHNRYVLIWARREEDVFQEVNDPNARIGYKEWYSRITRRVLMRPVALSSEVPLMDYQPMSSSTIHALVNGVVGIGQRCAQAVHSTVNEASRAVFEELLAMCRGTLSDVGEEVRLEEALRKPLVRRGRGRRQGLRGRLRRGSLVPPLQESLPLVEQGDFNGLSSQLTQDIAPHTEDAPVGATSQPTQVVEPSQETVDTSNPILKDICHERKKKKTNR